jgi:2-keto-4-pentenoate hydratase/2-oxohepta-3-ene-1,7-dioic acid hydratase in catechol pathway
MRLIRFGPPGSEKPGRLTPDGHRKDCSGHFADWDRRFFQEGGLGRLAALVAQAGQLSDVPENARWAAPIARPGKVIGIGLNYSDHAAESGMPLPAEPIVFLKASNTVCGPSDPILIPRGSQKTDWEVELGLIRFMTFEAGDVITTGTPPGVGLGRKPPQYLQAGDIVTLAVDGLGRQRSECVEA